MELLEAIGVNDLFRYVNGSISDLWYDGVQDPYTGVYYGYFPLNWTEAQEENALYGAGWTEALCMDTMCTTTGNPKIHTSNRPFMLDLIARGLYHGGYQIYAGTYISATFVSGGTFDSYKSTFTTIFQGMASSREEEADSILLANRLNAKRKTAIDNTIHPPSRRSYRRNADTGLFAPTDTPISKKERGIGF